MGLTGVIYALVVLAWAAYLLPQALRRHDEAARKHSIERFSSAMRVLARRGRSEHGRLVVTPPRSVDRVLTPSLTSPASAGTAREQRPRPSRAALKVAATRRRRVLVVLVALAVLIAVAAVVGLIPWWSTAVPVALIVAFLLLARRQVRRATDAYWDEVADAHVEPTNVITRRATRVEASHGATRPADSDDEPTVTLDPDSLREARVDVGVLETADGGSLWDPLPVTLPTYVDKPVARRSYRTVELAESGTWSSGHTSEPELDAPRPSSAAMRDEVSEQDVEAGEAPQAVNG
ncbi:MAG TPA: hypothetical protein VH419_17885 [Nocardioidaceae bacterium]